MSTPARDPYLDLALDGVQAIEASAGTGKTFTLATLVVRLVVERGLRIGEILAVTFTEAATQELRSRIRARLVLAASLVDAAPADDAAPEAVLTHEVLRAYLARGGENAQTLRRRLDAAVNDIDLAAIFTIHGFCARVLREHALESGQGFDAPELLASDATLREAIAADLWRAHGVDADAADDLLALWPGGPDVLAGDLSPLVRERVLRPEPSDAGDDPTPRVHAAAVALADAVRGHGAAFRTALLDAVEKKILNNASYKSEWIGTLFDALEAWCAIGDADLRFDHPKLVQLEHDTLLQRTSKAGQGRTPDSPVCHAVAVYRDTWATLEAWHEARRVARLHRLRDDARIRIARFKQQQRVQTYDDLIDRVADAMDGVHAGMLVERLRAQYAVALVDEFQDTDPRQWRIFERVFGAASGEPALYVIGDPKQAIYGFRGGDVETYLAARATAVEAPPLALNFRSRPSLLHAIAALYDHAEAGGIAPFVDARIRFHAVGAGGVRRDEDFLRDGAIAPALTLWQAPPPPPDARGNVKPYSAGRSRELATQACVAAIHGVLVDAREGRAVLGGRAVQPGDIAVLVRSHHEATRIRQALAAVGIPAVAAGKLSLYATEEARDVHALLLALLHGADEGRLRMALSTVLLGVDAIEIAAFDDDGEALRGWQLAALGWRDRLQRGGPIALIGDLCAAHADRLLGLLDGERRLTNYLQLAELLQEAQQRALGLHGLVDGLARAIASASADDESQLLRLESDARRVQVVTLHKSKGLEYPLVFLPFAGIGAGMRSAGRHVTVNGDDGRVLHWKLQVDTSGWDAAVKRAAEAQRAEDARLLYVGLTRARHALWLARGMFYQYAGSPLTPMLREPADLAASLGDALAIDTTLPSTTLPWLPPEVVEVVPPARVATRNLSSDWWVYSFTQLANADGQGEATTAATQAAPGGRDEPAVDAEVAPAGDVLDTRFMGPRFGVVLHDALERSDFAAWSHWTPEAPAPDGEADIILARLRQAGYGADDLGDGIAVIAPLVGQTLTVTLPEGVRLADVPADRRRPEIEFQFALAPTRVDALLALLHRHGLLATRHGFGARRTLEGLMTGLIDLTYVHDGRWYVLDYKSNRLPGYGPAQLAEAMAHSEYDLQALIYTLALHRWLRFRLGDGYDYARDFGGVRYVFCRGLDATRDDGTGIHAWRFDPVLVHELDALFAGAGPHGSGGRGDARESSIADRSRHRDDSLNGDEPISPRERGRGEGQDVRGEPQP